MKERGQLIRQDLRKEIQDLEGPLGHALGQFGNDFLVGASDGIGRKTELPWVRFCSARMSPRATTGYYVVLHFSTDGSGVNIAVGCSSSKFHNGSSVPQPKEELEGRCEWVRKVVSEARGKLEPFIDSNNFGARSKLPQSFETACALVKKVPTQEIEDELVAKYLIQAAEILRLVYYAQEVGRDLSPADQDQIKISEITRPRSNATTNQGFGLSAHERRLVELKAMEVVSAWLKSHGFQIKDTSAIKPYDFEASKGGSTLFIEVKGTTSDAADAILMTSGEVNLHRKNKGRTALMIVTGIKLKDADGKKEASGGVLEPLIGWDVDEWQIEPTAFRVSRNPYQSLSP